MQYSTLCKTFRGAQGENRTLMVLPPIDFESIASTNSATWAIHTFYTKKALKSIV